MAMPWWQLVPAHERITQGDVLIDCPSVEWNTKKLVHARNPLEAAEARCLPFIVMTQACDLRNDKVQFATLCPIFTFEEWSDSWFEKETSPTRGAFRSKVRALVNGEIVQGVALSANDDRPEPGYIVDLYRVSSLPLSFLDRWVAKQEGTRLRLLPPYREYLAQAFARVYMRVALPVDLPRDAEAQECRLFGN